jgi:TrfB transcriptional repressor
MADRERLRLEGRNGLIWRQHVIDGRTQEDVAQEHGITQERVSQIIAQVRASIPEQDRAQMVGDTLEVLRELHRTAMDLVRKAGAPVTAGKDGDVLYDPETGEVVRDYALRLNALKGAVAVSESMRRLVGLDAARGLDVNVTGAEDAAARKVAEDAAKRVAGED